MTGSICITTTGKRFNHRSNTKGIYMNSLIYCYSGTGNSLWTARTIAGKLGDAEVVPMTGTGEGPVPGGADSVGLVFPVHIWGVPRRVRQFIDTLASAKPGYVFAVAVNAGQVSNTLVQLEKLLKARGIALAAGFSVVMPSNYIPWGGPGTVEACAARYESAGKRIEAIADTVSERRTMPVEKGPLWQRIVFTWAYNMSFKRVPDMDKSFWTDEKCNSCGICAKVCPAGNIALDGGRPAWLHRCEQCLACIQWCPREAIQFGKKTPAYPRYHHPAVTLKDMTG